MQPNHRPYLFATLLLAAFVVTFIPYAGFPFIAMATFFHEFSHALVAIASGAHVQGCVLSWSGDGHCLVSGGWEVGIAFSGYFGTVVWGAAIYALAEFGSNLTNRYYLAALAVVPVLCSALWVRDIPTYLLCAVIALSFILAAYFSGFTATRIFLRFTGLSVLLDGSEAPIAWLDGYSVGDGDILVELTAIPLPLWIVIWQGLAWLVIFFYWRRAFMAPSTSNLKKYPPKPRAASNKP